ncbi:MAG: flagella basal body P-ring formation protein FlgA [Candidatus Planktophila sp.]|nr:flagella basal body P-ring formation protein FlgA [Candidatus Planktophila sp.]
MTLYKKTRTSRLPLAITLIAAGFVSTFLIATFSNRGADYWVITTPMSPGHQISASDVSLAHMNLDASAEFYLSKEVEPIGMIATRILHSGEIIGGTDLTSALNAMSTSAVPISVRSVDVATGLNIGEEVDIYWVLDVQSGDSSIDPILILGGVTLLSIDNGGKNFGSDTGLSIAVEETQVLRLLSATTLGRLVVIRSHV